MIIVKKCMVLVKITRIIGKKRPAAELLVQIRWLVNMNFCPKGKEANTGHLHRLGGKGEADDGNGQ